jgi:hypothetical protein
VKSPDQRLVALLNVAGLNKLTLAAFSGTPSRSGGFLYAFDQRLNTSYEARDPGPATLDVAFARPQTLRSIRLALGDGRRQWSVAVADSQSDLETKGAGFRVLVPSRDRATPVDWDEVTFPAPETVRALRLTVTPASERDHVVIREFNLTGEQTLESLSLGAASTALPLGEMVPLEVTGYYSGGSTRLLTGKALRWTITPDPAARISGQNRIVGRRKGPLQVTVSLGKLTSPPLPLEVVDGD